MSDLEVVERRLAKAERRIGWLTALVAVLVVTLVLGAVPRSQEVLKGRGLVIVDSAGRERIVLGAPMGVASADPKLAVTVGLAVLDSLGRLHVSVGANNPLILEEGRIGTRVSMAAGMTIYDPRDGRERGGIGAFADGRANVCLDYGGAPKEAACMAVAPGDRYAAVILNGTPDEEAFDRVTMYVGADGSGALKAIGGGGNRSGVMLVGGKGPASVTVYDSAGTILRDLARGPSPR